MLRKALAIVRFSTDHPFLSAVAVSFSTMSVVVAIETLERSGSIRHPALALIKQALCLIALPGFLVMMFWRDAKPEPGKPSALSLLLPAAGVCVAAAVFWYALKVFRAH